MNLKKDVQNFTQAFDKKFWQSLFPKQPKRFNVFHFMLSLFGVVFLLYVFYFYVLRRKGT